MLKFILIFFLFNFQSLRGQESINTWICTGDSNGLCWGPPNGKFYVGGQSQYPSQPLKLVLEIKSSLGASWYCNKEDWQTILDDIKSGYTLPEIRVSRLIVDKQDKVLEYKYFVVMKKLGERGILVSNSRRQTYGVIHYHDSPRLE